MKIVLIGLTLLCSVGYVRAMNGQTTNELIQKQQRAHECYNNGDFKQAFTLMSELAEQTDNLAVAAQEKWMLSVLYENGKGVKKDYAKSVALLKKVAEQTHDLIIAARANYDLGEIYCFDGRERIFRNWNLGKEYYRKAADQNHNQEYKQKAREALDIIDTATIKKRSEGTIGVEQDDMQDDE